jgi:hypothetical protein
MLKPQQDKSRKKKKKKREKRNRVNRIRRPDSKQGRWKCNSDNDKIIARC